MKILKMMKIIKKMSLALLVIGCFAFIVPQIEALTIKVKCDKGQSVQSVLDSLTGPATIEVTGTCNENVDILKDDVTIQGGTFVGPDPDQSTIAINGARRVSITGATIRGVGNGVFVYQGGSVTIENCIIRDHARRGIHANFGALVTVNSCQIRNNFLDGIFITDASTLIIVNSTINSNKTTGISVMRGSTARIGQDSFGVAGPNTIEGNGSTGIRVYQSSQAMIEGNTILDNVGDGVVIESASARLTGNIIRSNLKGIEILTSGAAYIGINDDSSAGLGNIIEENRDVGIQIYNGSSAYMVNNSIKSNARAGVHIGLATGRLIAGNTIEGNGGDGVSVVQGALFQGKGGWNLPLVQDNIIRNNTYSGISAWNKSSLDIQGAIVTNNLNHGIILMLQSSMRIYGSTVSSNGDNNSNFHGIAIFTGSAAELFAPAGTQPVSVTGNTGWGLYCSGDESSYWGDTSGVTGNGSGEFSCTGF
jgi:parallel beta-helix repeat protein